MYRSWHRLASSANTKEMSAMTWGRGWGGKEKGEMERGLEGRKTRNRLTCSEGKPFKGGAISAPVKATTLPSSTPWGPPTLRIKISRAERNINSPYIRIYPRPTKSPAKLSFPPIFVLINRSVFQFAFRRFSHPARGSMLWLQRTSDE